MRIAIASDLHLEFEPRWHRQLVHVARQGKPKERPAAQAKLSALEERAKRKGSRRSMARIAVASDLHIEHEPEWRHQLYEVLGRRDDSRIASWASRFRERMHTTHPEFGPDLSGLGAVDLYVMAGDIDIGTRAVEHAAEAAAYLGCPEVMVPGNHEFYDLEMVSTLADMRAMAASIGGRVHVLDRDRLDLVIDSRKVAVLGATLWTDYALLGVDRQQDAMRLADERLNDHQLIRFAPDGFRWQTALERQQGRHFRPADALALHRQSRAWLAEETARARAEADVVIVVTHHGPFAEASAPQYRDDPLSGAFVSDLGAEIEAWQPDLWICGHTHFSFERQIGSTRIISAQRGYLGAEPEAADFAPTVVEV